MPIGTMIVVAIVLIVVAVAAAVLSHFLTVSNLKNNAESKIGNAEAKAREIIDDAVKTAETKKKESLLEIKEESIKIRTNLKKRRRNADRNCSVTRSVYFPKRKLLIKNQRPLKDEKQDLQRKKKN